MVCFENTAAYFTCSLRTYLRVKHAPGGKITGTLHGKIYFKLLWLVLRDGVKYVEWCISIKEVTNENSTYVVQLLKYSNWFLALDIVTNQTFYHRNSHPNFLYYTRSYTDCACILLPMQGYCERLSNRLVTIFFGAQKVCRG